MSRAVRSHAKGCFIELDILHENGEKWETNYRWNYAVQENVKRRSFSFPEADVSLLLDLSKQLVNEHILLDPNVKDFADLAHQVCEHLVLRVDDSDIGGLQKRNETKAARSRLTRLLASKNKDLQTHLDDLAADPILMPGVGEHAMSINVFCSKDFETKQLVFVRLEKPVMSFMDSVIAAQYGLFCFGPPELEAACVAEGCAFAAVMSDYNFEMAVKQAVTPADVLRGFEWCIDDMVVLPHVHLHNSIRNIPQDGTPSSSFPGTPARSGAHTPGRSRGGGAETPKAKGGRNRPDAEDILEEILELCIQDFDHAHEEQLAGHDLHSETHQHQHVDGEAIEFDDASHTESYVQMMALDTDGYDAGRKRTRHRWHNALQQDCISELCVEYVPKHPSFGGADELPYDGGGGLHPPPRQRRPSFSRKLPPGGAAAAVGGCGTLGGSGSGGVAGGGGGVLRTERRRPSYSGPAPPASRTLSGRAGSGSYLAKDSVEWSAPHLPHGSARLMALTADELSDEGCIFLDVDAEDAPAMYRETGRRLRARMDALGLTRLVGELGTDKLLAFLDHGGEWPAAMHYPDFGEDAYGAAAAPYAPPEPAMPPPPVPPVPRSSASFSTFSSATSSSPTASSDAARKRSASFSVLGGAGGGGMDGSGANFGLASNSWNKRAKEEGDLFLETDHGGCGSWHEESMEVLCVHSSVLPPGRRVVILVRLTAAVGSDLGDGSPSIRWLFVCLGSFHPREVARNEGMARALSIFFASDDVYDIADRAESGAEILEAIHSFMRHTCVVPRARPLGVVRGGLLAAQTMAQERLQAAHAMWESLKLMNRKENRVGMLKRRLRAELRLRQQMTHSSLLTRVRATVQKFSLPLLSGVLVALVFCNFAPGTYEWVVGTNHHSPSDYFDLSGPAHWQLLGHPLTIHFLVNDLFMVFFFGLAAKEVTEALLPGGALNPLSKALSPLLATLGGVVGPVAVYLICSAIFYEAGSFDHMTCDDDNGSHDDNGSYSYAAGGDDDHRRRRRRFLSTNDGDDHGGPACEDVTLGMVLSGWGVPTATDISLAWMVAVLVFGLGHNAIGFLLLLAVVDDGIGLVIIAVFYPDPENPVKAEWLPLIPAGMLVAYALRSLKVDRWFWYVALAGPPSWFGFLLSHVHPALALVPIVPFMPATHFGSDDDHDRHHDDHHHGHGGGGGGGGGGHGGKDEGGADGAGALRSRSATSEAEAAGAGPLYRSAWREAQLGAPPPLSRDPSVKSLDDLPSNLTPPPPDLPPPVRLLGGRLAPSESLPSSSSSSMGRSSMDSAAAGCSMDSSSGGGAHNDAFGFLDFQALGLAFGGFNDIDGSGSSSGSGDGGRAPPPKFRFRGERVVTESELMEEGLELGVVTMEDYQEFKQQGHNEAMGSVSRDSGGGGGGGGGGSSSSNAGMAGGEGDPDGVAGRQRAPSRPFVVAMDSTVGPDGKKHAHPALHQFEHDLKLFVDFGMFFFAFANAGVRLSNPGGLTISIILALVVGKTLGISGFAIFGDAFLGVKLPDGVTYGDTVMVGFIASMGLTVALFVAGEAFSVLELEAQAKMGALLSGLVGPAALVLDRFVRKPRLAAAKSAKGKGGNGGGPADEFNAHVMRTTEEIDENVVREGLLRILKKRHADFVDYQRHQIRQDSLRNNSPKQQAMPPGGVEILSQLKEDTMSL